MIRIEVRQKHIDKGARGEGDNCPVFWAAVDAGLDVEYVDASEIVWWDGFTRYVAALPCEAQAFIDDYDGGQAMHPFYFYTGEPAFLEEEAADVPG